MSELGSAPTLSFTVDPWDPGYGMAFADEADDVGRLEKSSAELNLDLEVPGAQWRPIDPDPDVALPGSVLFLDGVRRIDARVWVHGGGLQPAVGIAASLAAGLVMCNGLARVVDVVVERGLFTATGDAGDLVTTAGRYVARAADGPGLDQLSLALQQRLAFAEVQLAATFRAAHAGDDDLLVVDGPLRGRAHLDRTVGYVKSHHASYLPGPQAAVVGALKPGQRTPAFTMGTSWQRNSWYLQLPGTDGVPWSGVVRLECSADLEPDEVIRLADMTARVLPPFASSPHKDPRAPQNLTPIGGLERHLKHRLGDERLLYRALRVAAIAGSVEPRSVEDRALRCRPSSQRAQRSIDPTLSRPAVAQGSSPRRAVIARSSSASIRCKVRSPAPSGPPTIKNPSSTSPSMKAAWASHPSCSLIGRDASQPGP